MNAVNPELDNSLEWVLFNIVSSQIASNSLWKEGEVFFIENLIVFILLRAVVNISIQTLAIHHASYLASDHVTAGTSMGYLWDDCQFTHWDLGICSVVLL